MEKSHSKVSYQDVGLEAVEAVYSGQFYSSPFVFSPLKLEYFHALSDFFLAMSVSS